MEKFQKEEQGEPQEIGRAVRMSAVKELPLEWLWPGRIVMENLTLLVSEPYTGKSMVAFGGCLRLRRKGKVQLIKPMAVLAVLAALAKCPRKPHDFQGCQRMPMAALKLVRKSECGSSTGSTSSPQAGSGQGRWKAQS